MGRLGLYHDLPKFIQRVSTCRSCIKQAGDALAHANAVSREARGLLRVVENVAVEINQAWGEKGTFRIDDIVLSNQVRVQRNDPIVLY